MNYPQKRSNLPWQRTPSTQIRYIKIALLEATRQLLRRNRSLSPFGKTANLNFLRALKLLSAWKQSKIQTTPQKWRQHRAALAEKVRRMQPLANKDWLMEMTEG